MAWPALPCLRCLGCQGRIASQVGSALTTALSSGDEDIGRPLCQALIGIAHLASVMGTSLDAENTHSLREAGGIVQTLFESAVQKAMSTREATRIKLPLHVMGVGLVWRQEVCLPLSKESQEKCLSWAFREVQRPAPTVALQELLPLITQLAPSLDDRASFTVLQRCTTLFQELGKDSGELPVAFADLLLAMAPHAQTTQVTQQID